MFKNKADEDSRYFAEFSLDKLGYMETTAFLLLDDVNLNIYAVVSKLQFA